MQSNQQLMPIIHPKRYRRTVRSWKHRANKDGNKVKKVTQYRIVTVS